MSIFKRVLVTGGQGFLGKQVVKIIHERWGETTEVRIPDRPADDLRKMDDCLRLSRDQDLIIHLAARVGGIGYNQAGSGFLFYDNAIMGIQLMEAARLNGVKKFIAVGTVCAYPKFTPVPFKEEDLWNGYPEETNAPYGLAKKMQLVQAQAYRQQYNFNAVYLLPVNLYGPGDNFDPASSHVIPALIRKMVEAREKNEPIVEIWGTGKASREFCFVRDAALAIVLAAEKYDGSDPVNIGSGSEITIRDLAEMIKGLVGYAGELKWNSDKPDGQPRRCLDVTKAKHLFGFKAEIPFRSGLDETVAWFENSRANV